MALLFLVLAVGDRNLPLSTASVSILALFRLLWHYLYLEIRPGEAVVRNGFAVHRFCLDDVSPRRGVPYHSHAKHRRASPIAGSVTHLLGRMDGRRVPVEGGLNSRQLPTCQTVAIAGKRD